MAWDHNKLRLPAAATRKSSTSNHGIVRAHVEQIAAARAAGHTWASIAEALGLKISRQTMESYYRAAIGQPRRKRAADPAVVSPPPAAAATPVVAAASTMPPAVATPAPSPARAAPAVRHRHPYTMFSDFGIVLSEKEDAIARANYEQFQDNLSGKGKRLDDEIFSTVERWIDGQLVRLSAAVRDWESREA